MSSDTAIDLEAIVQAVARNCAISDARHARDYSLCIYLLRMREHYRWQHAIPLSEKLQIDDVGPWITDTETRWDELEEQEYGPIRIGEQLLDPFDHESINSRLGPAGLVYAAGTGRFGQAHFFIGELETTDTIDGACCRESGSELIRDILPQPAMTQGNNIFIRHDCIRRSVWQQCEEWRLNPTAGPLADVITHFQLDKAESFESNLSHASQELAAVYRQHEIGEVRAGRLLGESYRQQTHRLAGSKAELYARAIRDLVADTQSTLPWLLSEHAAPLFGYWVASLVGIRKLLIEQTGFWPVMISDNFNQLSDQLPALQQTMLRIASEFNSLSDEKLSNELVDDTVSSLLST